MTTSHRAITPETSLAELASTHAGASRVFHRHQLDFCCRGQTRLGEACEAASLEPESLIIEIEAEARSAPELERWDQRPIPELIDHILEHFHEEHRREVPRLLAMARKVEAVHAGKEECPRGLAAHLEQMSEELEQHMQKEENVLFPVLRQGGNPCVAAPIQVMELEHRDHGRNLERLRELTGGHVPPAGACATWTALYLGLAELERDLMQHIHTENNILFPRALRD